MKTGDRVQRIPVTFSNAEAQKQAIVGTVVYIHPEGRFHTVEFKVGENKIRESFIGINN